MAFFARLISVLTFGLALGLTPPGAHAQGGNTPASGKLRIGLTGDYRPFSHLDPQTGVWSGMDVDMGRLLGAALGKEVEFVHTDWPGLSADLAAGRFDIAMGGISVTKERAEIGLFSSPILSDGKTPVARCENQFRFQTLPQIDQPGIRVIVNPGGTNERFARAHLRQAQLRLYPDNNRIFEEIIAGRADVMITDATEARLQARLHPELCAIHPDAPFDRSDKAYLMRKDERLLARVESWLSEMREKGALEAMTGAWINGKRINGRLAFPHGETSISGKPAGE